MRMVRPSSWEMALAAMVAIALSTPAIVHAQNVNTIKIDRLGEHEFVRDEAKLLPPDDVKKIQEIAAKLLMDKATPIIVTIYSMANHGGAGMRIETFARLLFDQWGIGHEKINGENWNTGILLLVSKNDRKARIELGAGWKREYDAQASQIMEELIIPKFKTGDYAGGILAGVERLDHMARGLQLPRQPRPWWQYALVVGAVVPVIFTAVSLYRRGASGWAWLFWAAVFSIIAFLLYQMMKPNSGGGYSGGSFGGGFSGGGGATGSW